MFINRRVILILGFLSVSILFIIQSPVSIASNMRENMLSADNSTPSSNRITSLEGPIASLIFDTALLSSGKNQSFVISDQNNSIPSNQANVPKIPEVSPYILDGYWRLIIYEDTVVSFKANFTMVHTDGSDRHYHEITNFKADSTQHIIPNELGIIIIRGISDIKTNDDYTWRGVQTFLLINKMKTIEIGMDSNNTDNHFLGQPIQGVANKIVD